LEELFSCILQHETVQSSGGGYGGISVAIGTLWEIAEWSYDEVIAGNVIKGKTDTMIDLIVDAIGAVMAGILSIDMVQE
jgi:hypothetical protein